MCTSLKAGRSTFVFIATAMALLASCPARASVVAFEPFQYPTGPLAGQSGGSGFSTNWVNGGVSSSADAVITPGLPQFDGTGNAFRVSSSSGVEHDFFRSIPDITTSGSVLWIRALVRADTIPTTGNPAGGFAIAGGSSGPFIGLGDPSGGVYISKFNVGAPSVLASKKIVAGQTYLFLTRVTLASGNDTVDLWINPDLSSPLPAPDATNNQLDFIMNTFHLAAYDNAVMTMDEIKMGTTLGDVVPEPSALALLAPLLLIAFGARR
jgi:hypothetical protein